MAKFVPKGGSAVTTSGEWVAVNDLPRIAVSSHTQFHTSPNVVILNGKYVKGPDGSSELSVSVDPAAHERKLAIREISASLDGISQTQRSTALGTS